MLCRTGLSIAIFGHSDDFFKVTHLHEESRTVLKRLHYRYASSRRVKLPENKNRHPSTRLLFQGPKKATSTKWSHSFSMEIKETHLRTDVWRGKEE